VTVLLYFSGPKKHAIKKQQVLKANTRKARGGLDGLFLTFLKHGFECILERSKKPPQAPHRNILSSFVEKITIALLLTGFCWLYW